jgi:hypothetical protein
MVLDHNDVIKYHNSNISKYVSYVQKVIRRICVHFI